ncbi:MAG: SMI1/KNR4 family protein [Neisseria sp.]|nr:SMI1/KNR4 family protein [Neisseria sp.]
MIYTLPEIENRLSGRPLPETRLIRKKTEAAQISNTEQTLGITFPPAFKNTISTYDLGNFEINDIHFGHTGDYLAELSALNTPDPWGGKWWQGETRPSDIIAIALSDPHTYLLDCQNGRIYALLSDDEWEKWRIIAQDFPTFLRIMATIAINNTEGRPQANDLSQILSATSSQAEHFWRHIITA